MTLADERRAIAEGMAAARKPEQVLGDLQSLESRRRKAGTLNELERRGARDAIPGRSTYTAPAATGGGIASPLTEPDAGAREYFDQVLMPTTDGLVWARWKSVKRLIMKDANNAEVVFEFKNGVQQ